MNDNIQKLYGALQKYGYNDLGTAEEFGAKVQDDSSRRKLYDAMSRDGFDDLGTYEEFSGKLVQNAKPQPVQATEPVKSESQKRTDRFNAMVRRHEEANGHVPGEEDEATEAWAKEFVANRGMAGYERRKQERHDEQSQMVEDRKANEAAQKVQAREQKAFEAAEGLDMFNEMRRKKGETTVAERAAELTKDQQEPLGANVEGMSAEELDKLKHSMGIEKSFTDEYERRKAEYAKNMEQYANARGDVRNKDFEKFDEEREWLKKNEAKYNDMKGRLDNVQSKFLELTTPDAMSDLDEAQKANRDQMASPSEVMASGYTPFGGSNIGSSEEAKENAIRTKADEIYNMARQTLNQGSKYDKGYEGNGMEQAATAIRQFIQGGINNVDKGSLTMGLSEGMALMEARKVGDKYNGIITDTIKDLGYSDRDVTRMMSDLEKKTKELEPVAQELERSRAEIEVMQSTLDEMIANGADESKIRSYTKELNKQINEYNKKIKDSESLFADYKKTRDQYDEVSSAVEAAIQGGLTGGEQAILDALQQYTKAQYLRSNDVSKAAAAGAGFEDTLEFMLGFILTGGLEKAGTKAATKLTMRHLEKKLGKRVGTDLIEEGMAKLAARGPIKASLGYKALTDVGVAAVRTMALPTRNIQTYGEQLAEYADVDKLGRLQFNRSKVNALANTAYQNFVENWSEGFGSYLSAGEQKLFRWATGNAPKVAIGKTLQNYRGSIGNYLDHGKFDGLFNEMMEEVGGSGLNWFAGWLSNIVDPDGAGIGDKEALSQFFAGEQLATTFLSFLPLSAIGAATNISAYNKMARRYDESVAKLNPLIESGALDAEKLEKIANEISGMTPERAAKRIIELGKETYENNHKQLPEDFAPAVMGYIQGKYAMDLRHDEWEDSREKMAVVQAYASAYEKPDLRNAWDSRQAEQETRAAAVEAGFTDEELDRNAYVLAQDAASIRETDPERSQVLSNYANAKSARAGLVDSYSEAGRKAEEEFDAAVRQNLSRDGIVIAAQVQENGQPRTVYITTKGVKINNDGTVSTPTGVDGPILYRDSATGEQKKVMASQLSGAEVFETENFIREANEADADVRARAFEAAENTVSMTGRVRSISANIGNNVVVRRNGVYTPVKIERMTNGGLGVVISGDKKALQGIAAAMGMQVPASQYLEAPVAQFYNLLSKEQDGSLTTFNEEQGQEQAPAQGAQGAPAQAAEEVPEVEIKPNDKFTVNYKGQPREVDIDQANDTEVWFSYTDENGNEATGVMTPYDFRESIVPEGTPVQEAAHAAAEAPAPAPAQYAFPVDEKGNRIYDDPSVSPQAAYDEIYNGVEAGSRNEANRNKFVAAKAAKAAKDVEDARNRIAGLQARKDAVDQWELPDNEELDAFEKRKAEEKKKFDDEIAQIEAGLPELERKAAHWNGVQTIASQRTAPAPAQAAPAPAPAAQKRKPKMSRRARIARAKQWEERTGVKVKIAMTPKQVTDKDARESLENGEIVYGWYDNDTHTVGLYLPYLTDEEEVDKTFIHEVISHRGLRALLGDEEYNKLLDRVWNELMSEQEQKDWLAYNEHLKGHSEEFLRRAAADEFIANLSEDLDVADHRTAFEKFVDWVKDLFNRVVPRTSEQIAAEAAGIAAKENISRDDLFTLLRDSLSNYEAVLREEKKRAEAEPMTTESLPKDIQDGLKEQGKVMEGGTVMDEKQAALKEATGYKTPNEKDMASNSVVGDVRMSKETMPAWKRNYMTYPEAKEHVVKVLENLMERMSADQLVNNVVPGGVYKYGEKTSGSKAGPLRTNIEYIVTFDMDTSCPRSLQYLEYVKKIEAQIGRPLTQTEMIQLIEMMRVYGQMIPCVYCYCENKRQALKQYYHDFMTARQGVINAKTEEEALAAMYGHETTKAARESNDPKVALTEAAYKVFTRWRSGEIKYNPSLKQLWSQYRNDRNVILTVLDQLLDNKKVTTFMTDETIAGHLCKELRIEDKLAKKAAEDLVGEWKWNRIENRPHNDFTRIEDEDDLVVGQETLALWREMTAYGKSASQAKNVLRYVPYTDELKTLSQKDRDYINGMGGLRMHSSNDFRIDYVLDYFQFMADMAVNHMYGHTYTKSPEFVRIFGNSGYKINMSIAAVEDANGIHPNSQEGFDWDEARELREKFPNAGVMLMATSDAQVQMALDSDWIDMFIPFHASGLPKAVWYDMRQWTDYSSIQNERFLNGDEMKAALAEDGVVIPKGTSAEEVEQMYIDHFNIHVERYKTGKKAGKRISPHFLPGKTIVDGVEIPGHNNDYETYIRLCREWGVHPRFYGLKVKDNTPEGGGREVDITEHPAYMKCIKETARTDTPQTAIEFNFDQPSEALGGKTPIDYAFEELQNRAAAEAQSAGAPVRNIYESYKQDPYGIVPQFINTIIKHKETTGKDYPLDYLTPDSRKWAMEERKALEAAYKEFDTIPYHPHEYDEDGNLIMEPSKDTAPVVANEGGESGTMLRKRVKPAPQNTKTGYAAFAVLQGGDGKYYLQPKMVQVEGQGTPVRTWLDADTGEIRRDKDGNMVTNTKGRIKVQDSSINKRGGSSRGQGLAWRPGKHLAEYPNATQFAVANPVTGVKDVMQDNIVFFEVSYAADKDYQTEAWEYGFDEKGNYNHSQAGLPYIPVDGYYKYRTNVNPDIPAMIITGAFKIERALTDAEAKELNQKAGGTWLERESGKPVDETRLRELGFAKDQLEERRDEYDFSAIEEGRDESAEVMKLEGYTPHAIDFDNENLKAAAKENGQDLDSYREGYQTPEERGWDRSAYTGESGTRFRKVKSAETTEWHDASFTYKPATDAKSMFINYDDGSFDQVFVGRDGTIIGSANDERNVGKSLSELVGDDDAALLMQEGEQFISGRDSDSGTRFRKAPNGKESNLTDEQWEMVRTPEFKAWFGDWENDPKNASKIVDENGEPMVMVHGSRANFSVFRSGGPFGSSGRGMYFGRAPKNADEWTYGGKDGYKYLVFLNVRNLYDGSKVREKGDNGKLLSSPVVQTIIGADSYEQFQSDWRTANKNAPAWLIEQFQNVSEKTYQRIHDKYDGKGIFATEKQVEKHIFKKNEEYLTLNPDFVGEIVVRDPAQIKSATDNNGQFDPNNPDIRFRKANQAQLGLVSNAGAALDRIKMEKATPEQWVKMLEKEGGLKAGEDKWIGLSDWLKSQDKKSITKDEIADYIAEHRIQIEEVKYSEPGENDREAMEQKHPGFWNAYSIDTNWRGETGVDQIQDVAIAVDLYNRDHEDKIVPYDTGRDGRPVLTEEDYDKLMDYGDEMLNELHHINPTRLNYTTDGLDNKREIALTVPTIEPWNQGDNIHFGDAGEGRAVAWSRFGETTDENGNRVLVIDEIQSKRHQDAREAFIKQMNDKYGDDWKEKATEEEKRKGGYAAPMRKEEKDRRKLEYDKVAKEMKAKYGDGVMGQAEYWEEVSDEDRARIVEVRERYREIENSERGIRPAPFENNWHELAMKRMLRLAAEEGYDYVAWTTGNQQADRYNMKSAIGKLYASKDGEKYYVEVYDPEGKEITFNGLVGDSRSSGTYTPDELVKYFGKEAAKEIIASADALPSEEEAEKLREKYNASGTKEDRDAWRKASFAEIDGSELFKGEGMKGFYDDILPRFMNKYGKKWGVKVQDITLPNVEEAGRVMHAVPVTQEMKDSVMEGQTMFRKSTVTPEQDAEYMDAVNSGDMEKAQQMVRDAFKAAYPDTKVVDENGNPMVVYHGTPYHGFTEFDKPEDLGDFIWTTLDKSYADDFTAARGDEFEYEPGIYELFANIRNPLELGNIWDVVGSDVWNDLAERLGFTPEGLFDRLMGEDGSTYEQSLKQEDYIFDLIRFNDFVDFIKGLGYDGVSAFESEDGNVRTYGAVDPAQIKSAEPVTRDDNGNVIPLSERFNEENNDIRFRKAEFNATREKLGNAMARGNKRAEKRAILKLKGIVYEHLTQLDPKNELPINMISTSELEDYLRDRGYPEDSAKIILSGATKFFGAYDPIKENYTFVADMFSSLDEAESWYVHERQHHLNLWHGPALSDLVNDNADTLARALEVVVGKYTAEYYRDYYRGDAEKLADELLAFSIQRLYDDPGFADVLKSSDIAPEIVDYINNLYDEESRNAPWLANRRKADESVRDSGADEQGEQVDEGESGEVSGGEGTSGSASGDKGLGTLLRKVPATVQERQMEVAEHSATVQAFGTMPAVIKSGVNGISRDRMPDGHKTDKGYYDPDDNNVYVCMDNVADERDAVATVVHETVGYKGLQELLGDRFNDMMTGVYAALDNAGRTWVNAYIARNGLRPGDAAVVRGMEEYMARTAERDGGDALENVNEVLSKIVGDLFGVTDFEFTDRELSYILRASYEHSVNPGWLDTPVGRAKDTLMKRELGINETDPNKPTDPDGGTRFRKSSTGTAAEQYKQDLGLWYNKMITENQNADLPVKIGMQKAMQEVFGDNWEEKMRSLPESQDYLMRHNVASSRAATEYFEYMLSHYEPMTEKVKEIEKLIAGEGAKRKALLDAYQRVRDYMYAVSGLERNEWERANGGEQKDWSGITSLMGYKDKDQWQQAEADARKMIDQFRKDLMNAVRKDGQTEAEAYADADAMLNELWALVQSCTDYSLDHAYKYGLLTRDEYERLRGTASKPRMWNYYLPLRGFNEKTAEDLFGYASLSGNGGGEVVEHAKGRWTEADNPLANILNIAQREIVNGNENWARQALLNFTINLGKNSLLSERNPWYVKDDATGKWKLAYPEPEVDPTTNEQTGTQSIEEFEAAMKAKQAKGEARQGRRGLKIDQIMANKGHRNQHLVHVKIGGSDRMIWVNGDPAMAKAISGYGRRERGDIEKAVRNASRVLSNLFTTYSLDFTAKNLIRDTTYAITALHMKEDKAYRHRFAKNWIKNFGYGAFAFPMIKLAAEWDSGKLQQKQNPTEREKAFMEFMRDGGQTGYTVVRSVEKLKKDLEKTMAPRLPKRFVDWAKVDINGVEVPIIGIFSWGVRTLNEAFELLTRFTTYQTSRDMGRTGQRAAYDAKEISVNFNRKGAQTGEGLWGQLASYLGATHYFYNAGVQGFDNFLRLYKTAPVKMGATSVAILGMGLLMPFINSMLAGIGSGGDDGGDDEWYWNLPEWVRRNNIIIGWKSTKKDEDGKKRVVGASYFALPLPVEFRAIYGLGDIAASAFAYQKMPNRTFGRVAGDILSTTAAILPFNPIENYTAGGNVADAAIRAVAPDIMMPFVDVATNRDYTGRALMKENPFTHVVPKNQGAYASTPKALVDACQWIGETAGLDLAPGVVRDVLNNYVGGYYRFAEDMAKQFFTDIDHPRRWDDIPFLSGFTGHIDEDRTNTYVNGVLNEYKRVSQKTVLRMNLFNSSDDITEKIAYETPELLPDKARVQRILSGKSYELGKMYYFGMKDKGTGEYHKVEKVHKSGKSAGKRYSVKEEIKIPGVETLKKRWKDAREYWATLPKGSPEAAEAYKDVTNAWHEYYNAQANLAEKLMNYEYGK